MQRGRAAPKVNKRLEIHHADPSRFDYIEQKLDSLEGKLEDNWLEIVTVVMLAVASLAAAWGGYQAARWGGVQSTLYAEAGAVRVESTRSEMKSQLLALTDFSIVSECSEAFDTEQDVLQAFAADRPSTELQIALDTCYEDRFGPELQAAMDTFFEPGRAADLNIPVEDPSQASEDDRSGAIMVEDLIMQERSKSQLLEAKAGRLFSRGQAANQQSDDYVFTTVFLATVLFFGGISTKLRWLPLRIGFVGFAAFLLAASLTRMASFPVM